MGVILGVFDGRWVTATPGQGLGRPQAASASALSARRMILRTVGDLTTQSTLACLTVMDDFFTSAEAAAWGGFLSTHGQLSKLLEDNLRRTSGLSHAEYEVLLRLSREDNGRLRIQALARSSVLTHSGTSRLVDRLEGAGLVERASATEDKRGAYAVLTEAGRAHFNQAARQHTDLVRETFLSHFSAQELKTLGLYWARLSDS